MRRALIVALGTIALGLAVGFTVFAGSRSASKPTLHVGASAPLRVTGRHFHDHERIRLTAGTRVTHATAAGNGYFVVTIPGSNRCNTVRVLARGSAGSYVVVKLLPAPACMPARAGS